MSEVVREIERSVFNDVFIPHMEADEPRTQIFFGGSASGKSVFEAQRVVKDVAEGNRNYLITRNVARTIRGSAFNEVCKAIDKFRLKDYFNINKSDLVITCLNGYQILFAGLDDTEKIKSITPAKGVLTDIWIEEATETERADVKQLNKRLRGQSKKKKRLTMTFNPILQIHWIYEEYFGKWKEESNLYRDKDLLILKTTYKDNKFLAPDDIYELESETDPYFRDVYTLGNWGVLGAVIFKNWTVEDLSGVKDTQNYYKNGLDFGFGGHPAGMIHTAYDKKRQTIYIFDEVYEYELTNDLLAEHIKPVIGNQVIVCDSAEPKSIKELRNLGVTAIGAKKGKDSVNFGIQWLQRQKIVVDVKCQNMKNELQQYKWKEDANGNALPVPIDKNNHLIDALRYAYEDEMLERRGPRFVPKPAGM